MIIAKRLIGLLALGAALPAHADSKISQLPSAGSVADGDVAPVVRSGVTMQATLGSAASQDSAAFLTPTGSVTAATATATGSTTARALADHFSDVDNAADYSVVCDGTQLIDGSITTGANVYASPSYVFTAADDGKVFDLEDTNLTVFLHTTMTHGTGANAGKAILATSYSGATLTGTARATFYKTDNTAAIAGANARITAPNLDANGHNTKGYKLNFPNGVCATRQIIQPRLSVFGCTGGTGACTLYEIAGTNADFIQTENQPALTGTGLNYGPTGTFNGRNSDNRVPTHFGLQDINLDCNGLGQTSGRCYATYGNSLFIKGVVEMENAHDNCVFTEMSDAPAWSLSDRLSFEEGHVDILKTHTCGNYGWLDHGPKDLSIGVFIDAESKSTGFRNEISSGYYAGTIDSADQIHGYAEADHTSMYFGAPANISMAYADYADLEVASPSVSIQHINTTACGYGGVNCVTVDSGAYRFSLGGADIEFSSGIANVIGLNILGQQGSYANVTTSGIAPGVNTIGIKVAGPFNNLINTQVQNLNQTGDICIDVVGSNNTIDGTGFSCATFLDPNTAGYGDGGQNIIHFSMYGGTNYVGAYPFASSDYVQLAETNGSTTTYYTQTPSGRSSLGKVESTGATPAVASGSGDCGTAPAIAGNNSTGKITVGTGTNGGKCTLTLANSASYANPTYTCVDNTQGTTLKAVATGTTLACTGTLTAGDVLIYNLNGYY